MLLTVITSTADILGNPQEPDTISNRDSQLLYGEQFIVEETHGAYVYGHSVLDGYKGYIERDQLVKDAEKDNALVKVRATHLYPEPSFKSRPIEYLSFLSRLTVKKEEKNEFIRLEDDLWIFKDHIAPVADFKMSDDLAQTSTIFLGTPYLYAGRSTCGIDCSAIVQQSMVACGYDFPPRDSCDQQGAFGTSIAVMEPLQRNDIVYFDGHVGIMMDDKYILNATARHMSTVIEDIKDLKHSYGEIKYIARL
jgi:cell wall-associated NlpC family hydrolase